MYSFLAENHDLYYSVENRKQKGVIMDKKSDQERRHHQRVPFIAEVIMSLGDKKWNCVLQDISLKGILVDSPSDIKADFHAKYSFELVLSKDAVIKMAAKITHTDEKHWGLEWEDIDLDSFGHLRRLLELNLGDTDKI